MQSEEVTRNIFPDDTQVSHDNDDDDDDDDDNQEKLIGDLTIKICRLHGLQDTVPVSIAIEVDR